MSSKLQHTYAELCKLKNQIRVQLNKVRPSREIYNYEKPDRSAKRIFYNKYEITSVNGAQHQTSELQRDNSRRHFHNRSMIHIDYKKSCEKKHYERQYADKVEIIAPIKRKKSAYLNIRTDRTETPNKKENGNSLMGVGVFDKSNKQAKTGKKTFSQKLAWKQCHLK